MNPADVAALPMPAADVSLIALFWQAHWVVKAVMMGLLACSVWVWAIVIDKLVLYTRTRRAMDRFEQAFWSGQSIEDLYRALSAKPTQSMAALFVAAMREWKRSFVRQRTLIPFGNQAVTPEIAAATASRTLRIVTIAKRPSVGAGRRH